MTPPTSPPRAAVYFGLLPGVVLSVSLALLALLLQRALLPGLSLLILALALGMALRNTLGLPTVCRAGVAFALRRVLRFAVMLLGLQISLRQVADVGGPGLLIVALTLGGSYLFTLGAGACLRIDRKLCHLIASGTSVCGASAVLAANTVAGASDEDAAYAVSVVTVFGSLSVLAYPLLFQPLSLSEPAYGLWAGASIHEVAQVTAAAFEQGPVSGEVATVTKLTRVLLLGPLVAVLGLLAARRGRPAGGRRFRWLSVPGFVLGFVGLCLVNTVAPLSEEGKTGTLKVTQFLLGVSLAAMGLETDVRKLSGKGLRPLLLGAVAWLFIAGFSYALIRTLAN